MKINRCTLNHFLAFAQIVVFVFCFRMDSIAQRKQFLPGQPWPDNNNRHINAHGGGITLFNGIYYWYGEHKIEGDAGNSAQVGVHVYSSKDLFNWKDEGIALAVNNDSTSDISRGCVLERPKVVYNRKTKKFVMWFHLELRGQGYDAARVGVATGNNPVGPFLFQRSFRPDAKSWPRNVLPIHKEPISIAVKSKYCGGFGCLPAHPDSLNLLGRDFEGGQMSRDMNIFIDDNKKAYLLYASEENSTIHISELTDDYLNCSGNYARAFVNRYMEAPIIFKSSNGKYYFIGSDCTGWAPNAARSAVAENIFGPWTELGNPCSGVDSALTFHGQGTFILPIDLKNDKFIFMADRWTPENPLDGKYLWLPLTIKNNKPAIEWRDHWRP